MRTRRWFYLKWARTAWLLFICSEWLDLGEWLIVKMRNSFWWVTHWELAPSCSELLVSYSELLISMPRVTRKYGRPEMSDLFGGASRVWHPWRLCPTISMLVAYMPTLSRISTISPKLSSIGWRITYKYTAISITWKASSRVINFTHPHHPSGCSAIIFLVHLSPSSFLTPFCNAFTLEPYQVGAK